MAIRIEDVEGEYVVMQVEDVEDESRNAEQVTRLMRESVAPTGGAGTSFSMPTIPTSAPTVAADFSSFSGFSALSSLPPTTTASAFQSTMVSIMLQLHSM